MFDFYKTSPNYNLWVFVFLILFVQLYLIIFLSFSVLLFIGLFYLQCNYFFCLSVQIWF